ncbi:MAG: type II toxin-antitoxin system HicB family antitoxin [Fimbriimonadales bacterium]
MKRIQVAYYKEGSQWVAQALNVEVSSFGDTYEEAQSAIAEALALYFEDESPSEVPEIESVLLGQVDVRVA